MYCVTSPQCVPSLKLQCSWALEVVVVDSLFFRNELIKTKCLPLVVVGVHIVGDWGVNFGL